jgi:ABC-type branched-subunit amino acid transport system substrate-binding protein
MVYTKRGLREKQHGFGSFVEHSFAQQLILIIFICLARGAQSNMMQLKFVGSSGYVDNPTQHDANVLRIGTAITLDHTAKFATLGGAMKNSFVMYFDWLNKHKGGVNVNGQAHVVELVLVDDLSDKVTVGKITDYLLNTLGLKILLAPYSSGLTGIASPKADVSGAVLMAAGSSATSVFQNRPTVFGTLTPSTQYLVSGFKLLGQAAATQSTKQTMAYVQEDKSWNRGICAKVPNLALTQNLEFLPGGSITIPADADEDAAKVAVQQLAALAPDMVTLCVYRIACHSMLKQMKIQKFYAKAMMATICVTEGDFIDVLGTAGLYTLGVTPWVSSLPLTSQIADGWTAQSFDTEYQARFGSKPPYQAASAWASCAALVRAIEEANSLDPLLVADKLRTASYPSMYGTVAFDANGQCTNEMKVVQYQGDPTFKMLYPFGNADGTFVYPKPSWADIECMNVDAGISSRYGMTDGVCSECVVGRYSTVVSVGNAKQRVCEKCAKGRHGVDDTLQFCVDCPAGSMSDTTGADKCTLCTPGAYQSVSGKSLCHACEPGTASSDKGLDVCTPCAKGTYAEFQSEVSCSRCALGRYAETGGSSACQECPGNGLTTQYPGAFMQADCQCSEGHYRSTSDRMQCMECLEGMSCAFGADAMNFGGDESTPELLPTYFSEVSDPLKVYLCLEDDVCPGGKPGSCNKGKVGLACSLCPDQHVMGGEQCEECKDVDKVLLFLIFVVCMTALVCTYWLSNDRMLADVSNSLAMSVGIGLLVTLSQLLGNLNQLPLPWPSDVKAILKVSSFMMFDTGSITLECMVGNTASAQYIFRVIAPFVVIVGALTLHVVSKFALLCSPGLCKRIRCPWEIDKTFNLMGQVLQALFIAFVAVVATAAQCYSHPNGTQSLVTYPAVICGSDDHAPIIVMAALLIVLFILPFMTVTAYANWHAPSQSHNPNSHHLIRYRFLFYRFRPTVWWWGTVIVVRQFLLAIAPTVQPDDPYAQIAYLVSVLLLYICLVCYQWPWKSSEINIAETVTICFLTVFTVLVGGFAAATPAKPTYSALMVALLGLMAVVVGCLIFGAGILILCRGRKMAFGRQYLQSQEERRIVTQDWYILCSNISILDMDDVQHLLYSMPSYDRKMVCETYDAFKAISAEVVGHTADLKGGHSSHDFNTDNSRPLTHNRIANVPIAATLNEDVVKLEARWAKVNAKLAACGKREVEEGKKLSSSGTACQLADKAGKPQSSGAGDKLPQYVPDGSKDNERDEEKLAVADEGSRWVFDSNFSTILQGSKMTRMYGDFYSPRGGAAVALTTPRSPAAIHSLAQLQADLQDSTLGYPSSPGSYRSEESAQTPPASGSRNPKDKMAESFAAVAELQREYLWASKGVVATPPTTPRSPPSSPRDAENAETSQLNGFNQNEEFSFAAPSSDEGAVVIEPPQES